MNAHCTTTNAPLATRRSHSRHGLTGLFAGAWDTLLTWQDRAESRARLATMPRELRRDLGLGDADIAAEVRKPFWRP